MPHVLVLKNGPRIAAGVLCALMALHPLVWTAVDLGRSDLGTVWDSWTSHGTAPVSEGKPQFMITTLVDLELGVLFMAATGLTLARSRFAGAVAGAAAGLTLALRLPLVWTAFTRVKPRETTFEYDSALYSGSLLTTLLQLVLAAAAAATLATGFERRPVRQYDDAGEPVPAAFPAAPGMPGRPGGPEPVDPEDVPTRPTPAAGAVGAVVIGAVGLFAVGWQVYLAVELGAAYGMQVLEVVPAAPALQPPYGWQVLAYLALFAVAAFLAAAKRPSARGLSMVVAAHLLLRGTVSAAEYLEHGALSGGPLGGWLFPLFGQAETLLHLVGAVVLVVLMARPGAPAWAHPRPVAAGGPQGPGGWGQPHPQPQPGGWSAPQQQPGYGYPAGPPQQSPQGGWGQPQPQPGGWGAPQQQPGYGYPAPGPAPQGQGGPAGHGTPPGPQPEAAQAEPPQPAEPQAGAVRAGVEQLPTQTAGPAVPPQPARPPQPPQSPSSPQPPR